MQKKKNVSSLPKDRKKTTSRELHEQLTSTGLNRDIRTVQNCLKKLTTIFDIKCDDSSKPYDYRWKENSRGLNLPVLIGQEGNRRYIACRFADCDNERSLVLPRILSAKATAFSFERPPFDLEKYNADGRFDLGSSTPKRLNFPINKVAGLHQLDSPLSEDQHLEILGEQFRISATLIDTAQLEEWLRRFGDQVGEVHREILKSEVDDSYT